MNENVRQQAMSIHNTTQNQLWEVAVDTSGRGLYFYNVGGYDVFECPK